MSKPVGFDQKIQLSHLDITANEYRYTAPKDMYEKLDEYLLNEIKGVKSRKNAITMLMKIWCLVSEDNLSLQKQAIEMFPQATIQERLALHWGMTILAYPFFAAVADEMGNFLKLQNEVPSQQLGRKIKLLYGDRRRVEVAIGAVLGSIKAWGITELGQKNIYNVPKKIKIDNPLIKNWILELLICISEFETMPISMLNSQNAFFPFEYAVSIAEIDVSKLKIERQGLDNYMVSLA